MLKLTPEDERYMTDACAREAPREACGIIAGNRVFELPNHAPDEGAFHIRGSDIQALAESESGFGDRDVDAVWHTHPSGDVVPSDTDLAHHPWPAALVIATRTAVTVYTYDELT